MASHASWFDPVWPTAPLGYVHTYESGTVTPKQAWKDQAETITHALPTAGVPASGILLDANGRIPTGFFLRGAYTIHVYTAAGVSVTVMNNVTGASDAASNADAALRDDLASVLTPTEGAGQVGFRYSLAYATGTVGDKLRQRLSLRDIGCVPDGDVNANTGTLGNAAKINAAIAALSVIGGGVIFDEGGVYLLDDQVVWPDGVSFQGAGKWATVFTCLSSFNNAGGLWRVAGVNGFPAEHRGFAVLGPGGVAGNGIVSAKNGYFASDFWVSGFAVGLKCDHTDNFYSDFAIEICTFGIQATQSDVNFTAGTLYECQVGATVSNSAAVGNGPIIFTGVRANSCPQTGFSISAGKNVQINGCSATHVNSSKFTVSGVEIDSSTDVTVSGFTGKLDGTASTTAAGIKVTSSSGVVIEGHKLKGWLDGIQTGASSVTIGAGEANGNSRQGARLVGGERVILCGGSYYANGSGAAGDAGIYSENTAAFGLHSIIGPITTEGGGGPQEYGIKASLTDNGANSGSTTIVAAHSRFNNTADIEVSGLTKNILVSSGIPGGSTGGASTVTVTAAYTVGLAEDTIICNGAATIALTLPAAASSVGRTLQVVSSAAFTVTSSATNVVPLAGGAAGSAILSATAGKWATLNSDGTNWRIVAAN